MINGKFLFTLIGIVLAIFTLCNTNLQNPIVENWWGGIPAQTVTAVPTIMARNGQTTALGGNYFDPNSLRGSGKFVSVPSFQGVLSPRFSNVQYGANIKYNMPDRENLATPCDPLTFGDMAKENYNPQPQRQPQFQRSETKENYGCGTGKCDSSVSCGKGGYGFGHKVAGGYELPVGYTNGNYSDVYDSLEGPVVSRPCTGSEADNNLLPVGTMSTTDAMGNSEQFVVMNRLMNTNMKSRLRGLGDPIRGDLAITPCQSGWFSVYPTINVDLQAGAMNVLAGHDAGESNAKLMELLMNASGGARTTFGGVNFEEAPRINMTPSYNSMLSASNTDVNVTAFP
jgi:hypothetical protein